MGFKPGDFFLGVVDFLGVLVPGSVLVLMQLDRFPGQLSRPSSASDWTMFLGSAFIVGQLLLAMSELLNKLALPFAKVLFPGLRNDTRQMQEAALPHLSAGTVGDGKRTVFHAALSLLRLDAPEPAAEVDRHMANYKLLRSLTVVFSVDLGVSLALGPRSSERLSFDLIAAVLSFVAFARMFAWAQLLAFQYCRLMSSRSATKPSAH